MKKTVLMFGLLGIVPMVAAYDASRWIGGHKMAPGVEAAILIHREAVREIWREALGRGFTLLPESEIFGRLYQARVATKNYLAEESAPSSDFDSLQARRMLKAELPSCLTGLALEAETYVAACKLLKWDIDRFLAGEFDGEATAAAGPSAMKRSRAESEEDGGVEESKTSSGEGGGVSADATDGAAPQPADKDSMDDDVL